MRRDAFTDVRAKRANLRPSRAYSAQLLIGEPEPLLVSAFFLSGIAYLFGNFEVVANISIPLLLMAAFRAGLIKSRSIRNGSRLETSLGRSAAAIFFIVVVASLLPAMIISFGEQDGFYSALYGASLLSVIGALFVIGQKLGAARILRSFYLAGILLVAGYYLQWLISGLVRPNEYLERYTLGQFHPNLLGLILAPIALLSFILTYIESTRFRKFIAAVVASGATFLLYKTNSRGSMLALVSGLMVALYLFSSANLFANRRAGTFLRRFMLITFGAAIIFSTFSSDATRDKLTEVFELTNQDRGLASGLSGRVDVWRELAPIIIQNRVFFGGGFRSSDRFFKRDIDNGYIVSAYDFGLAEAILLIAVFLSKLIGCYGSLQSRAAQSYGVVIIAIFSLLTCFLVNCVVARYFISIGNPTSLLAMCLLLSVTKISVFKR